MSVKEQRAHDWGALEMLPVKWGRASHPRLMLQSSSSQEAVLTSAGSQVLASDSEPAWRGGGALLQVTDLNGRGSPEITRIQVHQGGSKWLFLAQCHRMEAQEQRVFSSGGLGCATPPLPVFSPCSQEAAQIEPSSHCLGFLQDGASSIRVFLGFLVTATLKIKVSCLRDSMT